MATVMKPGWSKPSTILFASEIPANQKAFAFAVAQAKEFGANLILFHAYDTLVVAASETSGIRYYDYAAAARTEKHHLEPMAEQVRKEGIQCEVVVRPGLAADQILAFAREREIDRIVMGTHSPGPIGKLLVGSVAEAVLRTAKVPVFIVGPDVVEGTYRKFATRTIFVRRQPAGSEPRCCSFCGGTRFEAWRSPGSATRDPAAGASGDSGRPFAGRD
jgi:nucleotide-binding universal stress UspA family protein